MAWSSSFNCAESIRQRLQENAEVVGTDEAFFEDEDASTIRDLYTEQQGVLDDSDDEVDLASYAWQVWKQATQDNPELARAVESLPPVVYSAKAIHAGCARFPLLGLTQPRAAHWCTSNRLRATTTWPGLAPTARR
jgi:hypothetical protein